MRENISYLFFFFYLLALIEGATAKHPIDKVESLSNKMMHRVTE